jgi:phosphate starvation-inducible protein PhoH and related proteins
LSRVTDEFIAFPEPIQALVCGANARHVALIENAFSVLIETPGGGFALRGAAKGLTGAKAVIDSLAERARSGAEVAESDVRMAIGAVRSGDKPGAARSMPMGKRGVVAAKTAAQANYLDMLTQHELVFGVGPAGTGKTYLAVAHGANMLLRGEVDRLVVTRPAVEAGERLGFLPGDLTEKVDPYMAPVWEALTDLLGAEQLRRRREKGEIEVAPIAFMRGRTLSHAFVIVDEAQNASRLQMKMVLTRLGEGARMVVTGDPSQVDLLNPRDSGLSHAVGLLDGVKGVGISRFSAEDVVRHPLVERIVRAYDADSSRT